MVVSRLASLSAVLLLGASSVASAQAAAPACDVEVNKGNVARAQFTLEQARTSLGTPAAATALKSTVKVLETPGKDESPVARALILGEAFSLWLVEKGIGLTPTRGTVGFTTMPEQRIDLAVTVDSLFQIVQRSNPNCAKTIQEYRQYAFRDAASRAIGALNADQLDSAHYLATQATRINPASPYGVMVLGNVYSRRNDTAKAIEYWTQAAAAAGTDTLYRDVRQQMLANLGVTYLTSARSATGAEKAAAARKAAEQYTTLLAMPNLPSSYAVAGRSSLQSALMLAGDTAAAIRSYEPLLANSAAYSWQDLLNSAVTAARANRSADATKLFEGALQQNPYNRDALYNLGLSYLALERYDRVAPLMTRLVAVDPGQPENYYAAARAYLALAKAAEKAKKAPLVIAYNDSTVQWYSRGNKLPVEVVVTGFTPGEKQITLEGTVADRRDKIETSEPTTSTTPKRAARARPAAAAKPSFSPTAVTLRFEALDKAGAVVGSKTLTTEALTPGRNASFTVVIPAENAIAYRYTIGS